VRAIVIGLTKYGRLPLAEPKSAALAGETGEISSSAIVLTTNPSTTFEE